MSKPSRQEIHSLYRFIYELLGNGQRISNPTKALDLEVARKELAALESLLENTFKDKYPISDKILTPAGNPNYYSKLVSSLEASKDGSRSALAKLFGK
ncbi:unnamed protein product [Mucor hiemalis]